MSELGLSIGGRFWEELGIQQEWLTEPEVVADNEHELIWKMTAKEGYLFDDSFWEVFERFPFRICHVSYSGAPWSLEGGPPEMVLRYALKEEVRVAATKMDRLKRLEVAGPEGVWDAITRAVDEVVGRGS